ncbi:MAG: hypothetical protein FJX53_04100 [Alphaproteobacteria bacterium]|nr:hypothetical protein [Alphaproteobacteria bacterium]
MPRREHDDAGDAAAFDRVGQRHVGAKAVAADRDPPRAPGAQLGGETVDLGEHRLDRHGDLLPLSGRPRHARAQHLDSFRFEGAGKGGKGRQVGAALLAMHENDADIALRACRRRRQQKRRGEQKACGRYGGDHGGAVRAVRVNTPSARAGIP